MDNETELVERSRSGDVTAFARLVELHEGTVRRVAVAMMGTGGEADDVVQDAFVKAFTRLEQLDERPFRPWLVGIAANEARNRRRSGGRRVALALRAGEMGRAGHTCDDPELAAEAGEARRRLADAVATLPDADREIIALRYFAEMNEAEAAAALGCAPGTAKSRLSRALTRLRTVMAEEATR